LDPATPWQGAKQDPRVSTTLAIGAATADLVSTNPHRFRGWPSPGADYDVTALGTNDMHVDPATGRSNVPVDQALDHLDSYLDKEEAAGVECHVLVEIAETSPWGLDVTGPAWNRKLALEARQRRNTVVVPMASILKRHLEYLTSDGVHTTASGQAAYRTAVLNALAQCKVLAPQ
jgi:hypothetical protein